MSALADAWKCDASNVTWLVDRLEEHGLAERRAAPRPIGACARSHSTRKGASDCDAQIEARLYEAPDEFRAALGDATSKPCAASSARSPEPALECRASLPSTSTRSSQPRPIVLIPPLDAHPGGAALGVADYVDGLLGAFAFDPPLIFAGGPFSGRSGGDASFATLHAALARTKNWRGARGSKVRSAYREREFNGPVRGWQEIYRDGIAALGADFCDDRRRRTGPTTRTPNRELRTLLYIHACEGAYGRARVRRQPRPRGLARDRVRRRLQPRGYTDEEVSGRA